MTRLVLDTNVVIAGLLWANHSRRLLDLATEETLWLFSSPALIEELAKALRYPKFVGRLIALNTSPSTLIERYSALITVVSPLLVPRVIEGDPDDDQVLACASAVGAELIVTGNDKHFRSLGGQYQGIPILNPAQAVLRVTGG